MNKTFLGKPDCDLNESSLIKMFQDSFRKHWDNVAMTDYNGGSVRYKDLAESIAKLHIFLRNSGIKVEDKVALCGKNCSAWGVSYFAILTYGAVPVPILNDFKPTNIHSIVNHSEAKLLFVGDTVWEGLDPEEMKDIAGVILMNDFSLPFSRLETLSQAFDSFEADFNDMYPEGFKSKDINYTAEKDTNNIAILNYTSGTTSDPKGVMIPYRALLLNMKFACEHIPLQPEHTVVSILPMAHMFGLSFQLMFELLLGCSVCYLGRIPSPKILFEAFTKERPKIVITVPLIIEKIIKQKIFPVVKRPMMRIALSLPVIKGVVGKKIKQKIIDAFGGEMAVLIVGGAALNFEVEKFLRKIKFPYTVGYGATECAPLISYSDWEDYKQGSCGAYLPGTEVDIFSNDKTREVGEILVKGPHVMLGYFKNPNATREVIDPEGWYHTGDLGVIDKKGVITIKGRSKNMILGSSGQNIYPEEIEDHLISMPYVDEAIVVNRKHKLVALVYPTQDTVQTDGLSMTDLVSKMEENRIALNAILPTYSQVAEIELRKEPFEKTPKKSIRRFLYS